MNGGDEECVGGPWGREGLLLDMRAGGEKDVRAGGEKEPRGVGVGAVGAVGRFMLALG